MEPSFEKFNYCLRPAKQVERKLIIETMHALRGCGFPIETYTYVGFGSVYFVDFILFYKHLYINNMICIEHEQIGRRMEFNKPYKFIKLKMAEVADVVPELSAKRPHLVWLDYDFSLRPQILVDLDSLIQRLAPGSVVLVTIDARPRLPEELDDPSWNDLERNAQTVEHYREHYESKVGGAIDSLQMEKDKCPTLLARILRGQIQDSVRSRGGLEFAQLLNCRYADNAPMLTLGGILVSPSEGVGLVGRVQTGLLFSSDREEPIEIDIPVLTDRERQWIDSNLVGSQKGTGKPPFEVSERFLEAYRRFARYYPTYHESLL